MTAGMDNWKVADQLKETLWLQSFSKEEAAASEFYHEGLWKVIICW